MCNITIEKRGRRYYLLGNTYPHKSMLSAQLGGKRFDWDQKAWWTSKKELAEQLAARMNGAAQQEREQGISTAADVIVGRASYRGKTYYVLAHGVSQKTGQHFAKLCFRDGSKVFWAKDMNAFQLLRQYREPTSINALRAFAEQRKAEDRGEVECPVCARHCTCGQGFCSHHHDGCDRCGAEW